MENEKNKFSDNQIQYIIVSVFLILIMTFIFVKVLFF